MTRHAQAAEDVQSHGVNAVVTSFHPWATSLGSNFLTVGNLAYPLMPRRVVAYHTTIGLSHHPWHSRWTTRSGLSTFLGYSIMNPQLVMPFLPLALCMRILWRLFQTEPRND